MPLSQARRYAERIVEWIGPYCERLEIAGSIRRQRPTCGDVDIVCIPKVRQAVDLLGQEVERANLCQGFLQTYARESQGKARIVQAGVKQLIVELPKCQLDLWFASESTFGTRLLSRTGSREHNIWLCQQCVEAGLHWDPYEGLEREGVLIEASTEEEMYRALGLEYIEPADREAEWLRRHLTAAVKAG